ncbi:MAG: hypothetical protein KAX13_11600 [Candidatus Krumholzibacteria bacterium]|nr:hypothetical protein [Candidatus Krumholzibacteria bacterium]
MRKSALIVLIAVIVLPCSILAEEVLSGESERDFALDNRYSIGLDNIPWEASSVSFRIWKDERKGLEISLGRIDFGFEERDEYSTHRFLRFDRIRFDWLRRSQPLSIEGLFLVHGYGLGLSADAWERKSDRKSGDQYYTNDYYLRQKARIYLYLYLPLGIEYFFWERYPSVSFSVQADFYCRFGYGYEFEFSSYYNSFSNFYTSKEHERHSGYFTLGLEPSFYFRFYFK